MARNVCLYLYLLPLRVFGIQEMCQGKLIDVNVVFFFLSAYFQNMLSMQLCDEMFRNLMIQLRYLFGLEMFKKGSSI